MHTFVAFPDPTLSEQQKSPRVHNLRKVKLEKAASNDKQTARR